MLIVYNRSFSNTPIQWSPMPDPASNMMPFADAVAVLDREVVFVSPTAETLAIRDALGRLLVGEYCSRVDLPPFDKSAMDGYAVPPGDATELRVLETVPAGAVPTMPLSPGCATKVMTGAPVPDGTDRVVMVEKTTQTGDTVRIHTPETQSNICKRGEDVRTGDVILTGPRLAGPLEIANLAACGITQEQTAPPLRVAILTTGDEIVDSADALSPGKIMNSNGPMLEALCQQNGLDVVTCEIVPDQRQATIDAISTACQAADFVLLSGGVSVGDFDFVAEAMAALGLTIHFDKVAMKPGRPMTFATSPSAALFGLPGNPVSVYVMFHIFVLRAMRRRLGLPAEPRTIRLPLADGHRRRKTDRLAFVPCRLTADGTLAAVDFHGSAHLAALLEADGFFVMPQGCATIAAGESAEFWPTGGTR